jgi:Ca2+-dependent lipid-binding protein
MPSAVTLERHRELNDPLLFVFIHFILGSIDPYCEITVGTVTLRTPFVQRSVKPIWNAPMQFLLYDFHEDLIHIHVFDHEYFSPNGKST